VHLLLRFQILLTFSIFLLMAGAGCDRSPPLALIAGNIGGPGSADDVGVHARFYSPHAVTNDGEGHLFIADSFNNTIRKLDLGTGEVTTIAGSATDAPGSADGNASDARFHNPLGLACDRNGHLFVADSDNHTVRQITLATGEVTTIAGEAGEFDHQDGIGNASRLKTPVGLAIDREGNLFIADREDNALRKVAIATDEMTTLAAIDENGANFHFVFPSGVVSDGANSLFIADFSTVRKMDLSNGKVTTLAGSAGVFDSTDGTGTAARFSAYVTGLAIGDAGDLFIVDTDNNTIRKLSLQTGEVTTFSGVAGQIGSTDATGSFARFSAPSGMTSDSKGNIYIADAGNDAIRKVDIQSGKVTTIAGASGPPGSADGFGSDARFYFPRGITSDGRGNLFIADTFNNTIRRVVMATGEVTIIAGDATAPVDRTDGTGAAARFNFPLSVTSDREGNLFIADTLNHTIRKLVLATGAVSTLAGNPGAAPDSVDGTGDAARFRFPQALVSDGEGDLFVSDNQSHIIRKVVVATREVITVAGQNDQPGSEDRVGLDARFRSPGGLTYDGIGNLFIADSGNHTIRKMEIATANVTTLAGKASEPGSENGRGSNARFSFPHAVSADRAGHLFVADGNFTIRRVDVDTGEVTTFAGVAGNDGIRLGALPGRLSSTFAVEAISPSEVAVVSANAVLLIH
jgi:sugar lactone lactonase YvrE